MAEWFLARGNQVIIVGRTESKLQQASQKLNVPYYVLDTGEPQPRQTAESDHQPVHVAPS